LKYHLNLSESLTQLRTELYLAAATLPLFACFLSTITALYGSSSVLISEKLRRGVIPVAGGDTKPVLLTFTEKIEEKGTNMTLDLFTGKVKCDVILEMVISVEQFATIGVRVFHSGTIVALRSCE
jgi:hypothetical protein